MRKLWFKYIRRQPRYVASRVNPESCVWNIQHNW
jgi:hypothetical protein